MKNVIIAVILVLTFVGLGLGQSEVPDYLNPVLPIEKRVDDLLTRMTLEQKIGQMNQYLPADRLRRVGRNVEADEIDDLVKQGMIGSFLFVTDVKEANRIQKLAEQSALKIPPILAIDAIHGHALYTGATVFPSPIGLASTWNPELVQACAVVTAKEMRATGCQWDFSPFVEVCRDPRWGRTGESFGEDPFLVSTMGVAMVKGYQGNDISEPDRVLACPKHFVAGGQPIDGINMSPMDISERTLREIFFPPFKVCIDVGAWTTMAAHHEVNAVPCHASKWLLTDILRGEWGFQGFVVSDWGDMERLATLHHVAADKTDAFRQALLAGVNMHMHSGGFVKPVVQLVREGKISESLIDNAVKHILTAKFKLGLFENRYVDPTQVAKILASPEHIKLALQAARESIVLLKNRDGILPLKKDLHSIFVSGPNANSNALLGDWVGPQPKENIITPVEGLREVVSPSTKIDYYACGKITKITEKDIKEAASRAQKAKVAILFVGGNDNRYDDEGNLSGRRPERTGGENVARSNISLVGRQLDLVKAVYQTGTPTVVVLINGRPLAIPWIAEHVPAIIEAWEPGMQGGIALAEILFGDFNPCGKLPISFPRSVGHLQYWYNHKPSHAAKPYKYAPSSPLFDFGYGLSYTTFRYTDLNLPAKIKVGEDIDVSLTVANTGQRKGSNIVQVFINDVVSSVTTPVKKLVAFKKITLSSGEERKVHFKIKSDQLALYNREMKFIVEPGDFEVMVGRLKRSFQIIE